MSLKLKLLTIGELGNCYQFSKKREITRMLLKCFKFSNHFHVPTRYKIRYKINYLRDIKPLIS